MCAVGGWGPMFETFPKCLYIFEGKKRVANLIQKTGQIEITFLFLNFLFSFPIRIENVC